MHNQPLARRSVKEWRHVCLAALLLLCMCWVNPWQQTRHWRSYVLSLSAHSTLMNESVTLGSVLLLEGRGTKILVDTSISMPHASTRYWKM